MTASLLPGRARAPECERAKHWFCPCVWARFLCALTPSPRHAARLPCRPEAAGHGPRLQGRSHADMRSHAAAPAAPLRASLGARCRAARRHRPVRPATLRRRRLLRRRRRRHRLRCPPRQPPPASASRPPPPAACAAWTPPLRPSSSAAVARRAPTRSRLQGQAVRRPAACACWRAFARCSAGWPAASPFRPLVVSVGKSLHSALILPRACTPATGGTQRG
jgi:hypothetical protein